MELMDLVARAVRDLDHEVMPCDPTLADTAAFCEAYGVAPEDSANTIVVLSKKPEGLACACLALATTRLDVNHRVRALLGARKVSFASADATVALTGMEIGGVTPFGLPGDLPVYVDSAVMTRDVIVLGGGNRRSKLRVEPTALLTLPNSQVIENLAVPLS
ncbi:MAG: hypothetical protein OEW30_13775 [Acidimicrobiia bacterium]|nr:hypothetical protein [Acidimicrobiia bacterium]MDH5292405.1 hypothetical protein [Acidimicrobiia bacterium]